jgi:hypothetical protein
MEPDLQSFITSQVGENFEEAQLLINNRNILAYVEKGTLRGLPEDVFSFESATAGIMVESPDILSYKTVANGYTLMLNNNLQIDVIFKR